MAVNTLNLVVLAPDKTLVASETIVSVVACGEDGSFGLLPNHQPILTPLKVGVLEYKTVGGEKKSVQLPTKSILSADGKEVVILCE
jgi:F0F1-type ATP synthase epsilon subunit